MLTSHDPVSYMNEYYSEEDGIIREPDLLERIVVDPTPIKTPPPIVTVPHPPPRTPNVSSPSHRSHKRSNRRKTRPTQGDWVLMREMAPNRPDIAQQVSENALNSDSSEDEAMEDESADTPAASRPATAQSVLPNPQSGDLSQIAQKALVNSATGLPAKSSHRDSVVEADDAKFTIPLVDRRSSTANTLPNSILQSTNGSILPPSNTYKLSAVSSNQANSLHGAPTNGHAHDISLITSPRMQQLTISQPREATTNTLPALQTQASPRDGNQLPSFQHMDNIARSANSDHETSRANSFAHRQSVSSIGQSPTATQRQPSLSSHSPATPFPLLSASSPVSASSGVDIFLRSGGAGVFGADARRPSQAASEGGPYSSSLHSGSISECYHSPEGLSPGTAQTPIEGRPRHMSLDGALRTLPPPLNSGIQHIPSHGSGAFKCDYPSCSAAPFQTQYLLNSHANVHSQSRPHYCPVAGCPRSETGKGFKRKNEMIRHGLVHQSPGYVCPFCPDREHKYPRPDNLQRHVRVHHVDKNKDDPELREVLAQRPEGGSRGRRRRVSDIGC